MTYYRLTAEQELTYYRHVAQSHRRRYRIARTLLPVLTLLNRVYMVSNETVLGWAWEEANAHSSLEQAEENLASFERGVELAGGPEAFDRSYGIQTY